MVPDLSLIVPCYNEASHLRESVRVLVAALDRSRLVWEAVFVDDASPDDTRAILTGICAAEPRFRLLCHERNRGRGAAFKTGFAASNGRVAGFIDIDLEVHPLYIPTLVGLIDDEGYDVVTGYRIYRLSQTGAIHRHVISHLYRWLCRLLLGFGIQDSETGCKFFRRSTATDVVLESEDDGWFWDTEVMSRAALASLRIHEMPVLFVRRLDKASTVRLLRDSRRYLVALHRFRGRMGLSLLNTSPLYWTGIGYDFVMRVLYRGQYDSTWADVAARIPDGASVVDVCAGTCRLWRDFLRERSVEYLGLDFNGHLVMSARRRGAHVRRFNLLEDEVPEADYVVMCASFYHFHDRATEVLDKLRRAARKAVILSEPVENASGHGTGLLGRTLRALTNPGVGNFHYRFDPASFRAMAEQHGATTFEHPPGARHAVAVFAKADAGAAGSAGGSARA